MRARVLLGLVLLILLAPSPLPAETFPMPQLGISLTVPDGWTHDEKDQFGFVLVPPADQQTPNKNRKIRVHISGQKGQNFAEELERSIDSVTKRSPKWGSSNDRKNFLGSTEVHTKTGLSGLKGTFGYQEDGVLRYTINKYYFRNSSGQIICVCAYVFGPEAVAQEYEHIILNSLRLLPK